MLRPIPELIISEDEVLTAEIAPRRNRIAQLIVRNAADRLGLISMKSWS